MTDQDQLDAPRDFPTFVRERFGGKLQDGSHTPNGAACFHEALNVYQHKPWSDDTTGTLNLIALNDAPWSSDEARTEAMLPLGTIVLAWPSWTETRRQAWAKLVAEGVIRRILPPTLRDVAERIPDKAPELVAAALRCETDGTAASAAMAASAAWSSEAAAESADAAASAAMAAARAAMAAARAAESAEAAEAAAEAAWSAARAAESAEAAEAAAEAADAPLQELCRIMLEAEEQTRRPEAAPEPTGLDAAWAEAEAAADKFREGSTRWTVRPASPIELRRYDADHYGAKGEGKHAMGDTPEAALRALAARLREDGAS